MGPRVKRTAIPGLSKTPLWLLVLTFQILTLGGIAAALILIKDASIWWFVGSWGAVALLTALLVHVVVARRLSRLAEIMQQDPQLIVNEPKSLMQLRRFPWYGVVEVDMVQHAVAETYNAYAIDARRAGRLGGVSHSGGDDDMANLEWQSAVSYDDNSDMLAEYLVASQNTPRSKSLVRRIFTPRGSRPTTPRRPDASPAVAVAAAGAGGGAASSMPIAVSRSAGAGAGGYGSTSYNSFHSAVSSVGNFASLPAASTALNADAGAAFSHARGTAVSMAMLAGPTWDPLNDNSSGWDVLQKGLKDPGSSLLVQLLSQVKVGSSLSAVTLPVHILESRSLLEKLSDVFVSWYLLLPLARKEIKDPYDRLEQVFRWFISAYRMKPEGAKKPYNPILGEAFRCDFANPHNGESRSGGGSSGSGQPTTTTTESTPALRFLAEQVSHHPPVTALYAQCEGVCEVQGIYFPKSKLVSLNCAASLGEGGLILHITPTGERYQITFPSAYVSGITVGTPRLELGGIVTITDLGMRASVKVEFLRKGYFSGSYDEVKAAILSPEGHGTGREYYGTWFDVIMRKGVDGKPSTVFHDPRSCIAVRPHAQEIRGHPKQSRAIWRTLTERLRAEDAAGAGAAKHEVETVQRAERKAMAAEGREHETHFFKFKGGKPVKEARHEDLQEVANWRFVGHDVVAAAE